MDADADATRGSRHHRDLAKTHKRPALTPRVNAATCDSHCCAARQERGSCPYPSPEADRLNGTNNWPSIWKVAASRVMLGGSAPNTRNSATAKIRCGPYPMRASTVCWPCWKVCVMVTDGPRWKKAAN